MSQLDAIQATVTLKFDENQIEQVLRGLDEPISVLCLLRQQPTEDPVEFRVNATLCPAQDKNDDEKMPKNRTFYYLNGLLRCLVFLRLRYPAIRKVVIETNIKYLHCNARAKRIAQWKKRGFKTKEGMSITHRALWEELWNIMRFIEVETIEIE
jgi:hypothetical protein